MVRGEIKNCTPLWREAHVEVKMYKTRQLRTAFKSYDVEKLHAAVARRNFEVKMCKTRELRTAFKSYDVEKLHAALARSTF